MSLLNVHIKPARALIAVDTQAQVFGSDGRTEASKLLLMPHLNIVMAARGDLAFFSMVFSCAHRSPANHDFDQLAADMSDSLPVILKQHGVAMSTWGIDPCGVESEICIVGWSRKLCRMAGMTYERWPGQQEFTTTEIDPWRIGPNAQWSTTPAVDTIEAMQSVARDQVKFMRKHHPQAAIGGRLLVAELTRDAMTIREAGTL